MLAREWMLTSVEFENVALLWQHLCPFYSHRPQLRAHEGAGTENPCLCGGYGKAQGLSSLGHREPGDCTENKNITQKSGKLTSRIDDLLMDLGASYEILGRWCLISPTTAAG
jgi:hypothetical protein